VLLLAGLQHLIIWRLSWRGMFFTIEEIQNHSATGKKANKDQV
jgi:hypothetical protein